MKINNNVKGCLILSAAAMIWGFAFVAQSAIAATVPPFLLNSLRSFIAVAFLAGLMLLQKAKGTRPSVFPKEPRDRKYALLAGLICGLLLTLSVNLQQFGLMLYPEGASAAARGGFLTSLYVILVPLLSVFLGKKLSPGLGIAVFLALGGVYLLCVSESLGGIYLGDVLVLLCALSFSFHILVVERVSKQIDGYLLCTMQFLVCGIVSGVLTLGVEEIVWSNLPGAILPLLYMGILSSGVGYTMQIIGQKYAEPVVASLSMSLESVFAALGGWLLFGDQLSSRELGGCALVFLAIVLAQIPLFDGKSGKSEKKRKKF